MNATSSTESSQKKSFTRTLFSEESTLYRRVKFKQNLEESLQEDGSLMANLKRQVLDGNSSLFLLLDFSENIQSGNNF